LDITTLKDKIYRNKAIWVGTFLGGPLVAGYLIAANFNSFNESKKARITWICAIIATIVIFGGIFLIPNPDKVPRQVIPLIYTATAFYLVKHYQGHQINLHIEAGGLVFGWGRIIVIGLVGLAVTLIPIVGIASLTDSVINKATDTKTYGVMKHEIAFDKGNISETEVDKIAGGFTTTIFFDDAVTKFVYVKKVHNDYEISISCDQSVTSSSDALSPFIQLRSDMQKLFPKNKITFNLVVDNLGNVVKRLE